MANKGPNVPTYVLSAATVLRRECARRKLKRQAGESDDHEAIDVEIGEKEAALEHHRGVEQIVATGRPLVKTLLTVGNWVPFVGVIARAWVAGANGNQAHS